MKRREFLGALLGSFTMPAVAATTKQRPKAVADPAVVAERHLADRAKDARSARFLAEFPVSADGYSALPYGGMCCLPNGDLLVFGGGHAATAIPDVWRYKYGAAGFVSDYPVPTRADMRLKYLDTKAGMMNIPGFKQPLPFTRHTYSGLIYSAAINKVVSMSRGNGPYDGGFPEPGVAAALATGPCPIAHYDPVAKVWEGTEIPTEAALAYCEDPVSGNIMSVANGVFAVYDPRQKKQVFFSASSNVGSTYDESLVYFPPKDKFYLFARSNNFTHGRDVIVMELKVNRTSWAHALQKPFPHVGPELQGQPAQYVYDPVYGKIVGGLNKGVMYAFHPDEGWYEQDFGGGDVVTFDHHHVWDPKNQRHLVIVYPGNKLYSFVPNAMRLIARGPPPTIATFAADGISKASMQAACDAGGTVTISEGVFYVGARVAKAGVTITGAGADKTICNGGGSIDGKGALVVFTPTIISGITFKDVAVGDGNGAGIRHDATGGALIVKGCTFVNCQDGYLGNGASVAFDNCGFVDCGTGTGQTHAVYASDGVQFASANGCTFRGTRIGHHFKSRALQSKLTKCVMEAASESYCADFPWGGVVQISGCQMAQGPKTDNNVMVNFGSEQNPRPFENHSFTMSDCTLTSNGVANAIGLRFDPKTPVIVTLKNVHFVGVQRPVSGGSVRYVDCTHDGVAIPNSRA